ncbi:MAG: hypothetical protein KKH44_07740 [Bacteroidetes bacterium]|nr:hypothetical protein [Bacteroidota bacterium]
MLIENTKRRMEIMDNYGYSKYYGRHKRNVLQPSVVQKGKTIQVRIDGEMLKDLNDFKDYMNENNESKAIRDILANQLLTFRQEQWQKELKEDFR